MDHIEDYALYLVLFVIFAVLSWQLWHGRWLRLLDGTNFIGDMEEGSPFQRAAGRRAGVLMLFCCGAVAVAAASTTLPDSAKVISYALLGVSALMILVPCILFVVWARKHRPE